MTTRARHVTETTKTEPLGMLTIPMTWESAPLLRAIADHIDGVRTVRRDYITPSAVSSFGTGYDPRGFATHDGSDEEQGGLPITSVKERRSSVEMEPAAPRRGRERASAGRGGHRSTRRSSAGPGRHRGRVARG